MEMKKLTDAEFERLEKFRVLEQLHKVEKEVVALKVARLKDQQKLLETQKALLDSQKALIDAQKGTIETEVTRIAGESTKIDGHLQKERREKEVLMTSIRKRLDVQGRFGFNPDTLELVDDRGEPIPVTAGPEEDDEKAVAENINPPGLPAAKEDGKGLDA